MNKPTNTSHSIGNVQNRVQSNVLGGAFKYTVCLIKKEMSNHFTINFSINSLGKH